MAGIRSDWLARVDAEVERLTDDLAAIDVRSSLFLLREFLAALDTPPDALHGTVLSTVLMDVCGRIVHALHEQNPAVPCSCEAMIWSHVSRFTQWRDADPRTAFRAWLDVFFDGVNRNHPANSAVRAAQVIRDAPNRAWTLDALATAANARPAALRREFQARFGIRPIAYVHLARVTRAISLLRTPAKVEAVAWDLGYRSKKDLYAALSRWASSTPTEVRGLSDDESLWLERQLRIQCLRGVGIEQRSPVRPVSRRRGNGGEDGASGTRGSRR